MAKFLDTSQVSAELTQLIKKANEKLYLISPYLQISTPLKDYIRERDTYKIDIRVIYGKQDRLNPEDMSFLQELQMVKVAFCENLHAKCYLNEKKAIITSMNLYAYSAQNNREMGILVEKDQDPELYDDIATECRSIFQTSVEPSYVVKKKEPQTSPVIKKDSPKAPTSKREQAGNGFCIRCHSPIKLDEKHPLCDSCYPIWAKYSDPDYIEKYCQACGNQVPKNERPITYSKPICYPCYKKLK